MRSTGGEEAQVIFFWMSREGFCRVEVIYEETNKYNLKINKKEECIRGPHTVDFLQYFSPVGIVGYKHFPPASSPFEQNRLNCTDQFCHGVQMVHQSALTGHV